MYNLPIWEGVQRERENNKMANKFFNKKVWIVPGNKHRFRSEHDAKFYCNEHGIDFKTVEKYDSIKEYERWLYLQQEQKNGSITNLRRQVEFELTPKQYKRELKGKREEKVYYFEGDPHVFKKKKDAVAFAKTLNVPAKYVATETHTVPVYKDVKILDSSVYTADFTYIENGEFIVEDVKSDYTRREKDYVLRKKFLYYKYRILIRET